jgi:PEP-CTERM motif
MYKKILASVCIVLGLSAGTAQASLYTPFGAQTNVGLSTVTGGGWTQCYAATMGAAIGTNAQNVLSNCTGDLLMMAGRVTGSDTFLVLAETTLSDAILNTGVGTSNTHLSNGANWYFSPSWSWGFTAANDAVSLNSCDTSSSPTSMCLHTLNGTGGYRINNITGLNSSTTYEKVFFVASAQNNVPEPGSLALIGLGLAGLAVVRRRKSV